MFQQLESFPLTAGIICVKEDWLWSLKVTHSLYCAQVVARVCEGGEEGYGNTYETEIVYLKAFLKSPQLLKLEMLLVLLFTFIWNLPQREKKVARIIILKNF